ncbi:hypothetical protein GE022_010485 (plasmid) [Streptococcus canis]|uniref:hypothetical protein n=1 Tax=Streptococcus canis TaxID=1329 RepID=UPI0013DBB355|nr:hypothetical protein [Streptococcus canis]QKG76688.1 hypothetical protein GE022_010485 [Streptococcus canis]
MVKKFFKEFYQKVSKLSFLKYFVAWWASMSLLKMLLLSLNLENHLIYSFLAFLGSLVISGILVWFDEKWKK